MKYKSALLVTVAAVSVGAASQSEARHNGWYVGIEAGANWIDDTDVLRSFVVTEPPVEEEFSEVALVVPPFAQTQLEFDTGWAALATVGYAFDNNWRIEGELGFRTNDFDVNNFFRGKRLAPTSGDLTEYTAMINVIYDVPLAEKVHLNLGLGAGVDYADLDVNGVGSDSDTNFAYQAIAGVTYEISKRLDLTLTYRYLHVESPDFSNAGGSVRVDDLEKHTVTLGLRYDLYEDEAPQPPAPPPPPPPPAPQQFIIYFGFDKCNITEEADRVLSEAASTAKSQGSVSVSIVGHTDTMGSVAYNQRLSECRANAAKTNLVGKGIAAGSISTAGRGEGELLVKTGDSVKEPQNRRATIDLSK